MQMLTVNVTPEQHKRLRWVAYKEHRSMAEIVRESLDRYMEGENDEG